MHNILPEIDGEVTPERRKRLAKAKTKQTNKKKHPVVDVTGDRSKV